MNQDKTPRFRLRAAIGATVIGLSLASIGAHAADAMTSAAGGNVAKADRTFVEKATIGGMTEIKASQIAQEKGTNAAVKEFAGHMIADHTKVGDELSKLATSKSVTPPGTLDKAHEGSVQKLAKMTGNDFDKAYVKQMVSDHKATISEFEKQAKSGKDADLQAFASKTLPSLQEHLKSAQALNDSMK